MTLNRPCRILLVEDNKAELRLLQEAFNESAEPLELHAVSDGEEALNFMYGRDSHAGKPRPDLILLDINLPKINGHQVLRNLKNEPDLKRIPVLMLSGSRSAADIYSAYDNHANAYLQKPSDLKDYFHLVSELKRFWLRVVALPAASA
jgi:two-component system, chemotaxis family, response regulator Rcp1